MERLMSARRQAKRRNNGFYRRSRRERVSGFSCDIADGNRLIGGIVEDVSPTGFKMTQVSENFHGVEHCYRTVVSGNGKHFKILAKPCWKNMTPAGVEIGFKILDVSWEWTEMLLAALPPGTSVTWPADNA